MLFAFINIIGLGLIWTLVAIVLGRVADYKVHPSSFFSSALLMAFAFSLLMFDFKSVYENGNWYGLINKPSFYLIIAGSFLNALGQFLMVRTLYLGPKGITWSIGQSAMALPYAISVAVWKEPVRISGLIGLMAVTVGLFVYSESARVQDTKPGWIQSALLTFAAIGCGLTCFGAVPKVGTDSAVSNLRVPLTMLTGFIVHAGVAAVKGEILPKRHIIKYCLIWACLAIASYLLMFKTLEALSVHSLSGIVFPVAVGVSVLAFSVYSLTILNEKYSPREFTGLAAILCGILLLLA